jgi:hypothetical protein
MPSSEPKPDTSTPSTSATSSANEVYRTKSIATRLSEMEFAEVESAAASAGKEVGEWLRDAALAQTRGAGGNRTDPVLLAEVMGIRGLMLNLFAAASKGPISEEVLRKISTYSDAIKQQKAYELLVKVRGQSGSKTSGRVG